MRETVLDAIWRGATDGRFDTASLSLGSDEPSLADGQRLQLALLERWRARGERVGGWKLGMTSGQSRDAFGPGFRPFGFILESRILASGGRLSVNTIRRGGAGGSIENELCFVIGKALGKSATRSDALAAIAGVAPAFEVNQRRIQGDASPGIRIADDLANWGLVVGKAVSAPVDLSDLTVILTSAGQELDRVSASDHIEGHREGHIDDHYETLATLARKLAEHEMALQPGDRVITGAFTRTMLEPGRYEGDFGAAIGRVSVEVGA